MKCSNVCTFPLCCRCGIKIDMSPLYYLMERGLDPLTAYKKTYDGIMRNIEFRTWYHGQALGDAGEGEAVVVAVKDDLGNPWDSVMKNVIHDTKLKEWKGMNKAEKVAAKMADIIEQVGAGLGGGYLGLHRQRGVW